jgi:hypothetical protein
MKGKKMLNKDSLTGILLKKGGVDIDAAKSIAKLQTSASSGNLSGKVLLLPSGRTVAVIEATGRGTWICLYDAPPMSNNEMLQSTKAQMYDSRQIELTTEFLMKYGEEIVWNKS